MFLVEGGGVMIVMLLFVVVGIVGVFDMFVLKQYDMYVIYDDVCCVWLL